MTTLVLSARHTPDDQALWRAAIQRGWSTERVRGIAVPSIDDEVVIYAEALLAPTIAERLGCLLLDPPEDWLATIPPDLTRRSIHVSPLGEARRLTTPAFVKPPNDKSFAAAIYATGADLPDAFDGDTTVLVAEPVVWLCEYRCFCLDGQVVTISPYLLRGRHAAAVDYEAPPEELARAEAFAQEAAQTTAKQSPRALVIDVGLIEGRGWAVVEADGAWGTGIYGCDPDRVLDVVRHATVPLP